MTATDSPKTLPLPPGTFGLPGIGETLGFLFDPDFAIKRQRKYGSIFKTNILGRPTVVMVGADANRFILSSDMDCFSWREGWPDTFKELLGESLFVQEGEEHRRNRKLLMPAFHGKALANYLETMDSLIHDYLKKWEHLGTFTWFSELKQMTFEIASILLVGSKPGENIAQLSQWFAQLTSGLFAVPLRWRWTTYGKALAARNQLLAYIEQAVRKRQQEPAQDALGLLVQSQDEEGNALSMNELKAQTLLLLFAGHETTTSMLTSLAMALAQHPDVLAKARAEQQQFATEGAITFEQLKQMPYLEQILREVERLYPPIAGGFRGVVKSFEYQGYHVPAGWQVLYRIQGTHQDSEVYTNPKQFDPDRFSPERAEHKQQEFSLVGFGGGPRICLGLAFAQMEMKIFAAHLLRHYHWELLPKQNLTMDAIPTLHPRSGLRVRFSKL
ncbi:MULTISPECIES: cytochrome P450 [unclassified Coleofasciculus]|uniref:cytochrome P450 n=1 Tax=unclassified Coleofasciculus TaxID=2692782 RepID=UPI00188004EB|nr:MULTISPECIES: cytochrome P450 [unclassified Coleofasciculus]MBE9128244.1 cytochrome P450 [Coleofasciculus sp. LEGE 07081]MBE9148566.1 cytochrome P450 [Coleofasciculus sp. LEGE 07092]